MADQLSDSMHAADNPFNLGAILNAGLNIAQSQLAPKPVAQPTQQVLVTPGAEVNNPTKQVGETHLSDVLKKNIGWIIGGAAVLIIAIVAGFRAAK